MESIEQTFNGSVGAGRKVSCTISRNGDLIHRMYLRMKTDSSANGLELIKSVEVEIGGQRIDKHYGEWLNIWNELTQTAGHESAYASMTEGTVMYVPLEFWFCRNPGLALPLIALQYHEVKVNVEFDTVATLSEASLFVDYIYLDTDERRRFAQVSHEYLIEQLQFTGEETAASKIKLNFNHPVKELVWVSKKTSGVSFGTYQAFGTSATLQLNGHERFSSRDAAYFSVVQPYQHHERVPVTKNASGDFVNKNINVYSFALKPEEHQPSGTCNMSRIDNATLSIANHEAGNISVYAVNYNVLRIMSGMGGLAYSN
jgi:hypothetical protein